ncbi:hypothetical protein Pyn_04522 [Prunus yedoensis var. nudiflora]|uniref:Uncharacterized protein n=1 Tax=Prunus yedoensis var. nudiflora TaxID=2094558 RepID=A0A314Z1Y3_PRUYE|nr:hypothetical protein Pyn_04522 [Prunus yedoensis var. nudiflora]
MHMNTKKHSVPVNDLTSQTFLKKSSMIPPPMMINWTHVPHDWYITGKIVSNFPNFKPEGCLVPKKNSRTNRRPSLRGGGICYIEFQIRIRVDGREAMWCRAAM